MQRNLFRLHVFLQSAGEFPRNPKSFTVQSFLDLYNVERSTFNFSKQETIELIKRAIVLIILSNVAFVRYKGEAQRSDSDLVTCGSVLVVLPVVPGSRVGCLKGRHVKNSHR